MQFDLSLCLFIRIISLSTIQYGYIFSVTFCNAASKRTSNGPISIRIRILSKASYGLICIKEAFLQFSAKTSSDL